MQLNVQEAKIGLSRYIRMIEAGKEDQIVSARHGHPVVKMTLYHEQPVANRIESKSQKENSRLRRIWIGITI